MSHGLKADVEKLEKAMNCLGYGQTPVMLVGHSLGGFYAAYYAARHPDQVKAMVLLDANVIEFYSAEKEQYYAQTDDAEAAQWESRQQGIYYVFKDFVNTIRTMREIHLPPFLPVTDIVSDKTPFTESIDSIAWKKAHLDFAAASPGRTEIIAIGTGHFIHLDDPALVINAIIWQYKKLNP